jgi:hypothetical protein
MIRKAALAALPVAVVALSTVPASTALAQGSGTTTYQATLKPLNNQNASGTLTLVLDGSSAKITEHVNGLAAMFNGAAFPHVQHIHGLAKGTCPTMADDTSGDGVIDTTEAAGEYGGIQTTLSVSGDTSPASATNIQIAPSGASYDYSRTITLSASALQALQNGTAVIVVHGDDPSLLPAAAQSETSPLVPSLPLAATAPALCGALVAAQMASMPTGGAATGGGSTSGIEDQGLLAVGGGLLLAAAGGVALAARRRHGVESAG